MKNAVGIIVFIIIGFSNLSSFSQSFEETTKQGYVAIHQDSIIDSILVLHKKYNQIDHRIEGFRIQIFFESGNNSKIKATDFKTEFLESFPQTPAYISFKEPFYRVRVGDYKTKLEADQQLKILRKEYPNAWVIKDRINYPEVLEETEEIVEEIIENVR